MAIQYIKKTQKYEGVRIFDPKQQIVANTHQFRGHDFVFFNKKRGILIGKGLRPTSDMKGEQLTDYGWEDIVEHFKGMGFKIVEYDLEGKVKKSVKDVQVPAPQAGTDNNKKNKNQAPQVEEAKEDNK